MIAFLRQIILHFLCFQAFAPRLSENSGATASTEMNVNSQHMDIDTLMSSYVPVASGWRCPVCNKVIRDKSGLRRHLNIHLGIYRYHCQYCGKGMSSATGLKEHESTLHTFQDSFVCGVCGETFRRFLQLKQHKDSVHDGGS